MWELIKDKLKTYIPEESFKEWFEHTKEVDSSNGVIKVVVPDSEVADFIKEFYWDFIQKAMLETGVNKPIEFIPSNSALNGDSLKQQHGIKTPNVSNNLTKLSLNSDYTFENFVVGPSNELAFATCKAVAESPGTVYNPLYIYGGTGLGKTHLLHAVAHRFCELYPEKKILLISAERFFYDYVSAVKSNKFLPFREKYREVDILLVDDIQYLANKGGTKEEFFSTFNELFDNKKQIVISSDSLPNDIYQFQERLVSRFKWGIVADIQPPELETRIAILTKKAKIFNFEIDDEAIYFIATKLRKNVRELEGALKKCGLIARLKNSKITVEIAKNALKDVIDDNDVITPDRIMKFVADYYKIPAGKLKEKNNSRNIVLPRQIAMYLCKQLTNLSFPEIGKAFGNKHHTTVMYACNQVENKMASDPKFKRLVESFIQSLD
ncbi:chromosomal replication initiator protein [Thermotomaculum hydrothermale]|uniref:Chromosomal replication initiator protein DnaA n=1 Tax=Thermotomaculum hydrothermale TaxID=981385 RepID=A0A7R6PK50_9BACT|nr:chromosomal replication initiator protein DnaA [Thermotomaculum hydrothermale]BBB31657.1 chromosomal replication initiator protein [Thermotomaculum hydrothermale]